VTAPPARRSQAVGGAAAGWLEAGAGPALVLVHGAGGAGALWAPQLEGLADVARVIAPDLPGHGPLAGRPRPSVAAYAAWLVQFLDALGLDRVVLGGHSMGGAVAQTLALERPERLAGLVLVATGARLRVFARILELLRDRPPEGRSLLRGLSYAPSTPAGRVAVADRVLRETAPLVTLGDFLACDRFDVMARVGAIRAPTLVVAGADDQLTPPRYARFLAAAIPGAETVEVPGAGHFPQLEQPERVNAAIRAFLAARPGLSGGASTGAGGAMRAGTPGHGAHAASTAGADAPAGAAPASRPATG
jgi:pimeloyl-ACP methyl ester carboxylesterase